MLLQTAEDAESVVDMSTENRKLLEEDAAQVRAETLMRYIRVFSELSNQLRYASQKRVLVELAFIKLTKPQMEQSYDAILERLAKIEDQLEEGVLADPVMISALQQRSVSGGLPGGPEGTSGNMEQAGAGAFTPGTPPVQVTISPAQMEDLQLIRNDWGKIVRAMGGSVRSSFRDTVVEPSGEGCLCIVFSSLDSFSVGNRPTILGELEEYVRNTYGKDLYFKARLMGDGERLDTVYVSEEELRSKIHMDITIEDQEE